jgi:DNA ligase-associated metallophosphoesterase
MTPAPVHLAGERLVLDPTGALYWPAQQLLVIADLHLEKGSAAAAAGALLPPWDTRATLDTLALLLRRWRPAMVLALGDSFHDAGGSVRLAATDRARLRAMVAAHRFVWVLGNHDPAAPEGIEGLVVAEFALGRLRFRHAARPGPAVGEISGHYHPKARVPARGGAICRPCFVWDGRRLMLPALGAYTGGLDVRDPAITALFPRGGRIFLLGQERLFSFPYAALRAQPSWGDATA